MEKFFRRLVFLTLIVATMLATRTTTSSSPGQQPIDPACVESCRILLFECIASGAKNNCLGVYKQCVAHCKH